VTVTVERRVLTGMKYSVPASLLGQSG